MPTRLQSLLRRLPLVGRQVERLILLESGLFDLRLVDRPALRLMLAESSSTMTPLCGSRLATGRSVVRSANGRAKMSGRAAATPVRTTSSKIWRNRRRAEMRRSERSSSCMAAKRTGSARRLPMRCTSQGRMAASRPRRREGARKCIYSLTPR